MSLAPASPAPRWTSPGALGRLLVALLLCFAAGAIGSAATLPFIPGWYATLAKPPFNPPNFLFGPVWTVLYILMAIGFWRVWEIASGDRLRRAWGAFLVQLVLNALWSVVFFTFHWLWLALIVIVALLAAIVTTIRVFAAVDRLAAWLYAPYLAWVAFATLLNLSIAILN